MTCEECRASLLFYAAGQLPPAEKEEIAGHLASCAGCRRELQEELRFSRQVHNATTEFRRAGARIEERVAREVIRRSAGSVAGALRRHPRIAAAVLSAIALAALLIAVLPRSDGAIDALAGWAAGHYALLEQTHPLQGDARAVSAWFREHHGVDVSPPIGVDYSTLAGCKMTEMGSEQAPLLRFEGRDTSGVFILPARFRAAIAPGTEREITRGEYRLTLWSEKNGAYLKIVKAGLDF